MKRSNVEDLTTGFYWLHLETMLFWLDKEIVIKANLFPNIGINKLTSQMQRADSWLPKTGEGSGSQWAEG